MPNEITYVELDVLPDSVVKGDVLKAPILFKTGVGGYAIQSDVPLTEDNVRWLSDSEQRAKLDVPKRVYKIPKN